MDTLNSMAKGTAKVPHPFYPLEANIVGYLANDWTYVELLTSFAAGWVVILGTTQLVVRRFNPNLSLWERAIICWFILSGTIHFFFEGYFAVNHTRMAGMNDYFGQLWKEYAYSDSRYLTSDPFVLCMESVTAALWGPLSYVVVWMIVTEHPLRHPMSSLVCIGQMYGDVLYYATSLFDHYYNGIQYWRPEAFYFWSYYFFMNFIWIVIPGALLYNSFVTTAEAFTAAKKMSKSNGTAKKRA
ncbi:hypothetical protein MMC19_003890 [Ptychographa xylographoides]|nr:hypothetical protein [Ptychographa xylographoides]